MAGRPIEIPITVTADGAEKGVSKVTDAFSDVEDSLKDVTKAGEKTGKDLSSDMSDAAKKIDRDLTKALDSVQDESKSSGKAIGKNVKAGTDKAGEGLDELKDESKSTAKEAAASFGSIEDAASALQEVAANAFAGFGPAGMAAGALAAVGIGLAISALTDNADKINENKDKMLALAQTIKDNGGVLRESDYIKSMEDYGYAIQDTKEWFELFQKDAVSGFEQIRNGAEKAGVGIGDAFKGQFGSLEDSKLVLADLEKGLQDLEGQTKENSTVVDDFGRTLDTTDPAIRRQIDGNQELTQKVRDHIKELEAAKEIERIRKEAIQGTTQALKEDIEALEKRTDAVKNSESSELDYLDGIDNLNAKLKENGETLDKSTSKGRDNRRAVLDQASAIEQMAKDQLDAGAKTDDVTKKFQAQKDALITQVMPAFGGSREKAQAYIDTILRTPPTIGTKVNVTGIPEAEAQIRNFTSAGRHIYVDVHGNMQSVQNSIAGLNGTRISVDVAPRLGAGITN